MRFQPFEVEDAEWARRLEALRFGSGKWDLHVEGRVTVARGALVLSRAEHEEVVATAEALAAASLRTQRRLREAPDPRLGLNPASVALARAQEPGPYVTRIDLFQTADGWMASEMNDDVPGGHNEAIGLPAVLHDLVPGCNVPGDLPAALVRLLAADGPVGLVYATGYAEDLQVVGMVAALLADAGVETVPASPANLEMEGGKPALLGRRVAGLYRFFPSEWFAQLPNLPAWRAALAAGVPVANPFPCAWTQSKAAFLPLREGEPTARRHLPETFPLDGAMLETLRRDGSGWVLKPAFGRMGEGVVLGDTVPPVAWRKALASAWHARATRPFVAQRRFAPVPVEAAPGKVWTACVGAYVADGRFAGYYSRIQAGPVVAYNATNLLTVVEGV